MFKSTILKSTRSTFVSATFASLLNNFKIRLICWNHNSHNLQTTTYATKSNLSPDLFLASQQLELKKNFIVLFKLGHKQSLTKKKKKAKQHKMLYKLKMVQNMERDSGSNICYINGNITVLIFAWTSPLCAHETPFLHQLQFSIKWFGNVTA